MNKLLFSILAIFSVASYGVDQVSDSERIQQGREIVQKYAGQINAATANVAPPSLNTNANSPLFQTPQMSQAGRKDFMDLATGKRRLTKILPKKKDDLMIFVSFSMPPDMLKEYSKQAKEYGAVLVLRGFYQNSLKETQTQALEVNPVGAEWDIAPATYKKFKIDHVPAIVLADSSDQSVLENGCAREGDYLRVDGNISIHQALVVMKQYGNGKLVKSAENLLDSENN